MINIKLTERDMALFEFINKHDIVSLESAAILFGISKVNTRQRLLKLKRSGHINYQTFFSKLTAVSLSGLGYASIFLEKKSLDLFNISVKSLNHKLKISEVAAALNVNNIAYYIPNIYGHGMLVPDFILKENNTGIEVELTLKSRQAYAKKLFMLQESDIPSLIYVCSFKPESLESLLVGINEDDMGRPIIEETKSRIKIVSFDNFVKLKNNL
ncbi:MAG: hypothetical protein M1276_02685 [Deltaproteobacteria bacterium]|jgi:hypothetical protein|nr:hypothetical protein [Deltaproteobacteria bacterium]